MSRLSFQITRLGIKKIRSQQNSGLTDMLLKQKPKVLFFVQLTNVSRVISS